MNTTSESRADRANDTTDSQKILVWDMPVRIFHWLMVLSFAGAYLTAESERWRLLHVTLGYTMAGLVIFRILWGLIGTRYARFSSFVHGPDVVKRYVEALMRGRPEHHTGHNPAGALAIIALLGLTLVVALTGWVTYYEIGSNRLEDTHEAAANVMLAIVLVHVAGVVLASWLHRENLVFAMFSGRKSGKPGEGIRNAWRSVALLMIVAVLGFWAAQWGNAPSGAIPGDQSVAATKSADHDRDNDDD